MNYIFMEFLIPGSESIHKLHNWSNYQLTRLFASLCSICYLLRMHRIEYWIVKGLFNLLGNASLKTGKRVADVVYFLVAKVFRYRRKVILDNLHRVYGETLPAAERILLPQIYRNFVYLWMEFLQAGKLSKENVDGHFILHNMELVDQALNQKRGMILMAGHFGNFEWVGQLFTIKGYKISGIAKRQSNPYVNDLVERTRRHKGTGVIYTKNAMEEGLAALKRNEIIAIVADQDARKKGIFVDFLGQPSSTAVGPAIFYLRSGAPIYFVTSIRRDYGKFDVYLEPVIEDGAITGITDENIRYITQTHATVLEKWVRKYPEQWFWMHKRWKTHPQETIKN